MEDSNGLGSGFGNSSGGVEETRSIEVRFTNFCKSVLSLDEKTYEQAMKVLRETKHLLVTNVSAVMGGSVEEAERYWFAFVCYVVRRLGEKNKDNQQQNSDSSGLTLCKILSPAKLSIVNFFKELPQFLLKAGSVLSSLYGVDWETNLQAKELQANFVHLSMLSRHYKNAYRELFLTCDASANKESADSNDALASVYHHFGWLLFLALRIHAFSRFKDLVKCTNGLASVLAILIIHIPVRFRNFTLNNSQWFGKRGDNGVDLLASLCNKYDTSKDELKKTMEKANNLIADMLKKKPCSASECSSENLLGIDRDGLIFYEDLMEESSLQASLNILEKVYEDGIQTRGELDKRVFINEEYSILGSRSLSKVAAKIAGKKRKLDMMSSPIKTITSMLSPHRSPASHMNGFGGGSNSKIAAAPVSAAMTTAKWLRTVISLLPSRPSARLEHFLASCDRDVTEDVIRRAEIILEAIFPSTPLGERCVAGSLQSANLMDDIWAEQRKMEVLKLYYRVLEKICVAESQMLHPTNLTSLLTNERFHRCMIACSAELVLATHKTITVLLPTVLERTGITAFDLSKVIESFIRHEDSLPRELRRHLNSLEERLLESVVWQKGSSMYNSLIVAKPSLSDEINRLGLLAEPMPSLDSIAMHVNYTSGGLPLPSVQKQENCSGQNGDVRSPKRLCTDSRSLLVERNSLTPPMKDRLLAFNSLKVKLPSPALQSAFASPTRPIPGGEGETCAETEINVFFSKINKLAAVRINGMVERLQQSQQHIRENVYRLYQQILTQKTPLFFNRHIDQIILCCFYGIAKISKLNPTFEEIIYNYRKQPQCNPEVYRCVFNDWSPTNHHARTGQDHIHIIKFYNKVFIPTAKSLLVDVGSVGVSTKANQVTEIDGNKEGQFPASPQVSSFPSLPDMSPKKVSATLNVYVSPLRTSKMDALMSHTSKSYYACVGERTRAYQSPSKDLSDINNRLNGRKARVALNFDDVDVGLVSDSVVANSLNLQNGSCASTSDVPLKSELPQS